MAERCGVPKRTKPQKLTLEGYLDFIRTEKRLDLTVDHLNQIIHMHGFKKFLKTPKSILLEVVGKMELLDPSRSTIHDYGVSSDAFLALDDVIKDLSELKWQECCVTSIQTLNAASHHYHDHPHESRGSVGGGSSAGTIVSASSEKQPKRPRRRLRKLAQIGAGGVEKETVSPRGNIGSSESPVLENWSPRKRRTVKYVNVIGSGIRVPSPVAAGEVQPLSSAAFVSVDA